MDRIADCLTVEGYVDRQGARTWYWNKVDSLLHEAAVDPGAGLTGADRVG